MAEKLKPAFDAFSVEKSDKAGADDKPFFRPIGAAWPTKADNGALNLVLKVLPIDGRVLLLPYKERPPEPAP